MRQKYLFAIAGVVTLWIGGCATDPGADQAATTAPEVVPIPAPAEGTPVAVQPQTAPGVPAVQATPPAPPEGTLPPELIGSTDPGARLQEVRRNRPDPFSLVPTTPIVVQTPQTPAPAPVPAVGGGVATAPGVQGGSPNLGARPTGTQAQRPRGTGQLAPIPSLVPSRPLTPPPPPTDLARAVKVLGVVQIGSIPHAIVQAPNEPSTRYVREGQVLSNGQVVVRRIEMTGLSPEIVLVQNGVEVVTAVGEGGVPQPAAGQPAASAIAVSQTVAQQ